jgi:hypothetical protein
VGCPFFIEGLLSEPLCILRGASFIIGGLLNELLRVLRGASFFIGCLFSEPLCILRGNYFFIIGLLDEPMNEGCDSAPLFMALMFCVKPLLNFQPTSLDVSTLFDMNFLGNEALLMLRVHKLCLIKNLTPLQASPMRKRVQALENKCVYCATVETRL